MLGMSRATQDTTTLTLRSDSNSAVSARPARVHVVNAGAPVLHADVHMGNAGVYVVNAGVYVVNAGAHVVHAVFHVVSAGLHVVNAGVQAAQSTICQDAERHQDRQWQNSHSAAAAALHTAPTGTKWCQTHATVQQKC